MTEPRRCLVHGTAVAADGRGALILGPSGAGKSDLALRAISSTFVHGGKTIRFELVADDQVIVEREGDRLIASPPTLIAGKLEIRGIGIVDIPYTARAELVCAVRLCPVGEIERLPDPPLEYLAHGLKLPLFEIDGRQASAVARLGMALALSRVCN